MSSFSTSDLDNLEEGLKTLCLGANVAQTVQGCVAGGGRLAASAFLCATAGTHRFLPANVLRIVTHPGHSMWKSYSYLFAKHTSVLSAFAARFVPRPVSLQLTMRSVSCASQLTTPAGVAAALALTDAERQQLQKYHDAPSQASDDKPRVNFVSAPNSLIYFDKVSSSLDTLPGHQCVCTVRGVQARLLKAPDDAFALYRPYRSNRLLSVKAWLQESLLVVTCMHACVLAHDRYVRPELALCL